MAENSNTTLQAIADALGLPLEAFKADASESEIAEMATALRLWLTISDPQARRRILTLMLQEADRSGRC